MVTKPTVLGSYWPNLETPSLSSLQTSTQRRSTTTWKWRDPNRQPSGESHFASFHSRVSLVVASPRNVVVGHLCQVVYCITCTKLSKVKHPLLPIFLYVMHTGDLLYILYDVTCPSQRQHYHTDGSFIPHVCYSR